MYIEMKVYIFRKNPRKKWWNLT